MDSGSGSEGGEEVRRGEIVARLELATPAATSFFVQATLPVPPGTLCDDNPKVPLAVVNLGGLTAPTQVETVTRYPRREDGASVVEVISRVRRDPDLKPGDPLVLWVVKKPHHAADMRLAKTVRSMLGTGGAMTLHTRDVFGHDYRADLFRKVITQDPTARKLRQGSLVHEYALHEVLAPVEPKGGAQGTLSHLMGVHAYVTTYDRAEWFLLDLHVHNGMDGLDPEHTEDDAQRELFFEDLRLRLPKGWKASALLEHPSAGAGYTSGAWNVYPLVKPQANGKLHWMPRQGRFARRLVVYREGHRSEAEAVLHKHYLAFCRPGTARDGDLLWSWWNPDTPVWFPQAQRLPSLDFLNGDALRAELEGEWIARRDQLASGSTGTYPLQSPALGWAQPWGVDYGGMTGMDEINVVDGMIEASVGSREGYLLALLTARCYIDRQPTALYSRTGRPTRYEDLLVTEGFGAPYVDCNVYVTPLPQPDPFGFTTAPTFQVDAALAQGRAPNYRDELDSWMPIDIQHYIRHTRNLKILAWLGNDSLARDQLEAAGEVFRLGFHAYRNSAYGYTQNTGLRAKMDYVAEYPGIGVDFQRGEGWGTDAAVAAYLLGNDELRQRYRPWFAQITDTVVAGQSTCTGNLMATPIGKLFEGQYRVRFTAHASYADNALRGIQRSVFAGADNQRAEQLGQLLVRHAYGQMSPPFWNEEFSRPWFYMGVGEVDGGQGEFCTDVPGEAFGDYTCNIWFYSSLAYAYEETGDEMFLYRAAEMLGGGDLLSLLEAQGTYNLQTTAALIALLQEHPVE